MTCLYSVLYRSESGFDWPEVWIEGRLILTEQDPEEAKYEALLWLGERFRKEPDQVNLMIISKPEHLRLQSS